MKACLPPQWLNLLTDGISHVVPDRPTGLPKLLLGRATLLRRGADLCVSHCPERSGLAEEWVVVILARVFTADRRRLFPPPHRSYPPGKAQVTLLEAFL